jgi:UDP-3-O-[3-hydroxymyristoyl] glucosamine N-acyltransferase
VKQYRLQQIAEIVSGDIHGNGELLITDADILRDAGDGFITFAEKQEYFDEAAACSASAVLIPKNQAEYFKTLTQKDFVAVENVAAAFTQVVSLYRPPLPCPSPSISARALIDPSAQIGIGVSIESGVVVGKDVCIGDRCRIHAGVQLMPGTEIGDDTVLFPNVVMYENTIVGKRCRIHANAVIGCDGFGYESSTGSHALNPQLGNVEIGDDVDVGAGATIDRATYGSTRIGEGTKIDNQVQIGHNCRIGKRNLICSLVGIAGSCTTGDNVVMAGQVGIGDHIAIGEKAVLGAKAGVMADIPEGQVYVGIPATPAKQQMTIIAATHRLPEMRKRIKQLEKELQKLMDASGSIEDAA